MKKFRLGIVITLAAMSLSYGQTEGEEVFRTYCWGCHHQTATAFAPSFREIASKRSEAEIRAMIADPERVSKALGYRRNAMPKLQLSEVQLQAITRYILSFKPIAHKE